MHKEGSERMATLPSRAPSAWRIRWSRSRPTRSPRRSRHPAHASAASAPRVRFVTVTLHEPPKAAVLASRRAARSTARRSSILLDNDARARPTRRSSRSTSGRVVSLGARPGRAAGDHARRVRRVRGGVQGRPAAGRRRCASAASPTSTCAWSTPGRPATTALEDESGRRLSRALTWVRAEPGRQRLRPPGRGRDRRRRPQRMEVLAVEDYGVVPLPPERRPTTSARGRPAPRTDLKPLEIHQPEGPSFSVDGHEVRWQKWRFRVGFTPREGLVLHTVSYDDQGRERPILYRASLCRDGRAVRRPAAALLPPQRLRRRRVRHRACWPTRSSWAATAWARSATSTRR